MVMTYAVHLTLGLSVECVIATEWFDATSHYSVSSDVWCFIIGNMYLLAYVLMHCSTTALSHVDENAWPWALPSGWITSDIMRDYLVPSIRKEKLHQAKSLKPHKKIKNKNFDSMNCEVESVNF